MGDHKGRPYGGRRTLLVGPSNVMI